MKTIKSILLGAAISALSFIEFIAFILILGEPADDSDFSLVLFIKALCIAIMVAIAPVIARIYRNPALPRCIRALTN